MLNIVNWSISCGASNFMIARELNIELIIEDTTTMAGSIVQSQGTYFTVFSVGNSSIISLSLSPVDCRERIFVFPSQQLM